MKVICAARVVLVAVVLSCYIGGVPQADDKTEPTDPVPASDVGPRALRGQVLGDEGRPLEGAVIRFKLVDSTEDRATERTEIHVVHSDKGGRFATEERTGQRFDVRIHAEGHAFWTGRDVDPSRPLSVRLVPGLPLAGRVLAEKTGYGIAGATVRLDDDESFALSGTELETSTDEEGRYAFSNVPPGNVWIRASAPGRATRSIRGHLDPADDSAAPAVLDDCWLPEGGRLSGRVEDAEGAPVPGAEVLLNAVDAFIGDYRRGFSVTKTRSDDDGFFSFDGITAPTRYTVLARSDRHAPRSSAPLTLEAGDELEGVTLTLHAGAALRLRLVGPEQDPVTELTMRIEAENHASLDRATRHRVVTTDSGKIERDEKSFLTVRHLPPGLFTVRLEPRGWMGLRREGVTLVEGETTELGTMNVRRGSTVTGTIVDADDEPIGDAEIMLRWRDLHGDYSRRTKSAEDGTFRVSGLPEFPVALTASAAGFVERRLDEIGVDGEAIAVRLARQGSITGTVALADGGVPRVFSVRAVSARSVRRPSILRDGSNGTYEIDRLAPGSYTVLIRAPGNARARLQRVRVREGVTTDAGETVLARGLRLEGRIVRDDDGAGCPGARLRLDRGAGPESWSDEAGDAVTVSDLQGRFRLDGLEAGRYTLTLVHPEFAPLQRSVDLEPEAETTDLELRLGTGGEIRGTVVDADGLPLVGVDVFMSRGMRGFDRRMVATRDDGSFRFPRVAPGSYVVVRSRSRARTRFGSQMRTVEVRAGATVVVDFSD